MDCRKNIAKNLRLLMAMKNKSIRDIEKETGLNKSSINNLLQEHTKDPRLSTLETLAEVLGCRVVDLIGEYKAE